MKDITIDEMNFSGRTKNSLKRMNIFFLSQLMCLTEDKMRCVKNIGNKTVTEILEYQISIRESIGESLEFFDKVLDCERMN